MSESMNLFLKTNLTTMNIHAFLKFCKEHVITKKGYRPTVFHSCHTPGINELKYMLPYSRFVTEMLWTKEMEIFTITLN